MKENTRIGFRESFLLILRQLGEGYNTLSIFTVLAGWGCRMFDRKWNNGPIRPHWLVRPVRPFTGVGMEAIEGLRFLASLPLAGTGRTEGGQKTQPFNHFHSHPVIRMFCIHERVTYQTAWS